MTGALTQPDIDRETAAERAAYGKRVAGGAPVEHRPRRDYAPYRSSALRRPRQPPVAIDVAKDPEPWSCTPPRSGSAANSAFATARRMLAEEGGGTP